GLLAAPFGALAPGMPRFGHELPGTVGWVSSRLRQHLVSWDGLPAASLRPYWQPRHVTAQAAEPIHHRRLEVLVRDSDPEVERGPAGLAGQAVPHVSSPVGGQGSAGPRPRPVHWAWPTPWVAPTGARRQAEPTEHLPPAPTRAGLPTIQPGQSRSPGGTEKRNP